MHTRAVCATLTTIALLMAATPAPAQEKKLRVGVFDSRAVALAFGRSADFQKTMGAMRAEYQKAKEAGDNKRVQELEKEGPWTQVRLHQQVFSTATVSGILARVKDKLPAIAAQASVSLIVSKWELQFHGPGVEIVDVTMPLVKLFNPDEATAKMAEELGKQQPVPFDQLSLDPML